MQSIIQPDKVEISCNNLNLPYNVARKTFIERRRLTTELPLWLRVRLLACAEASHLGWIFIPTGAVAIFMKGRTSPYAVMETRNVIWEEAARLLVPKILKKHNLKHAPLCLSRDQLEWICDHSVVIATCEEDGSAETMGSVDTPQLANSERTDETFSSSTIWEDVRDTESWDTVQRALGFTDVKRAQLRTEGEDADIKIWRYDAGSVGTQYEDMWSLANTDVDTDCDSDTISSGVSFNSGEEQYQAKDRSSLRTVNCNRSDRMTIDKLSKVEEEENSNDNHNTQSFEDEQVFRISIVENIQTRQSGYGPCVVASASQSSRMAERPCDPDRPTRESTDPSARKCTYPGCTFTSKARIEDLNCIMVRHKMKHEPIETRIVYACVQSGKLHRLLSRRDACIRHQSDHKCNGEIVRMTAKQLLEKYPGGRSALERLMAGRVGKIPAHVEYTKIMSS